MAACVGVGRPFVDFRTHWPRDGGCNSSLRADLDLRSFAKLSISSPDLFTRASAAFCGRR